MGRGLQESGEEIGISLSSRKVLWYTAGIFLAHLLFLGAHPIVSFDGATCYMRYFDDPQFRKVGTPGYPIFVWLFRWVFDPVLAGQLVSALFGSLLVFPVLSLLESRVVPMYRTHALCALVLNPLIFRYGLITMSDVTGLFFIVSAFALFERDRWGLSGLAFFMAYLTRPEYLILAPFFFRRDRRTWAFYQVLAVGVTMYVAWLSVDRDHAGAGLERDQ